MTVTQGTLSGIVIVVGGVGAAAIYTNGFGLLDAKYDNFLDYAKKALKKQPIGGDTFETTKITTKLGDTNYKDTLKEKGDDMKDSGINDANKPSESKDDLFGDQFDSKKSEIAAFTNKGCEEKSKLPKDTNKKGTETEIKTDSNGSTFEEICLENK